MKHILTIDLGNHLGWSYGTQAGQLLQYGSAELKLKTDTDGERLPRYYQWLKDTNDKYKPDVIAFEAARSMASYCGLISLAELQAITKLFCENNNVPYIGISATNIKKHITGSGTAKKADVAAAVQKKYNITTSNDNVCDAIACYDLILNHFSTLGV